MSYDPALALQCAHLSADIYRHDTKLQARERPDLLSYIDVNGTQALLVDHPNRVYVVFCGTTYEDIPADFKCRRKRTPMGGIHRGFLNYTRQAQYQISAQLRRRFPRKPIVFTGHSLGAAAAVIAAAHFHRLGHEVEAVYTFGEPRVGNAEFKGYANAAFGERHFRHVNGHDGVPLLPPWLAGYRHSGHLIYFSTRGQKRAQKMTPLKMLLERLPLLLTRPWKWAQSKRVDHAVFLYVAACERNLKDPEK